MPALTPSVLAQLKATPAVRAAAAAVLNARSALADARAEVAACETLHASAVATRDAARSALAAAERAAPAARLAALKGVANAPPMPDVAALARTAEQATGDVDLLAVELRNVHRNVEPAVEAERQALGAFAAAVGPLLVDAYTETVDALLGGLIVPMRAVSTLGGDAPPLGPVLCGMRLMALGQTSVGGQRAAEVLCESGNVRHFLAGPLALAVAQREPSAIVAELIADVTAP